MKLITRQSLANSAAERWLLQYPEHEKLRRQGGPKVYRRLLDLGSNPEPDEVDEITGNSSWTTPERCGECGATDVPVVIVGEPDDYDSRTAAICEACARRAADLFSGARIRPFSAEDIERAFEEDVEPWDL